jgi:hypothetical protein
MTAWRYPSSAKWRAVTLIATLPNPVSANRVRHAPAWRLICDNYATHKTPAVKRWLERHPRFHLHFVPTSTSWLNMVERWFAELTNKKIRRGTHRSVFELERDIRNWIDTWNENPRPYVWVKTADEILKSIARYLERLPGNSATN